MDYDGENVRYCSGWDVVEEGIVKTEEEVDNSYDDGTHRDYELLNEIINELLAQDITRTMHEAGIYLYSSPENAKNNGATSYQYAARLVIDFYNEFKPLIIESTSTPGILTAPPSTAELAVKVESVMMAEAPSGNTTIAPPGVYNT